MPREPSACRFLPLANGTNCVSNHTLQYRVVKKLWPEIEFNLNNHNAIFTVRFPF